MRDRLGTRKTSREGVEFARGWWREEGLAYGGGSPLLLLLKDGDGMVETYEGAALRIDAVSKSCALSG